MKVIVTKPTDKQREIMEACPIWEHDAGSFPWKYEQKQETCLILEGKAYVVGADGNDRADFGAGDLVTFPRHWDCTWTIEEKIRKHYIFDAEV